MTTHISDTLFYIIITILIGVLVAILIKLIIDWVSNLLKLTWQYITRFVNFIYFEISLFFKESLIIISIITIIALAFNAIFRIADNYQLTYWIIIFVIILILSVLTYKRQNAIAKTSNFKYVKPLSYRDQMNRMTVEIPSDDAGHYYIDCLVNNIPVRFLIDTGASSVSIPEAIAKICKLPKGQTIRCETANGFTYGWESICKEIIFGNIRLNNTETVILPNNSKPSKPLLGMSALSKVDIQIIGSNKMLLKTKHNR